MMASIFSEEAEEKAKVSAERERAREDRALKLRDTRSRVRKYDRLRKRNAVKVKGRPQTDMIHIMVMVLCMHTLLGCQRQEIERVFEEQ